MARRTRIYTAFDADSDIRYYRMLQAWAAHDHFDLDFNNAHDLTSIWERSGEATIKRHLRERMDNAKLFVLLVGEKTKALRKYVPYEIELALEAGIPIVVVNLNLKRSYDDAICPALLKSPLAIHIGFAHKAIAHAFENWPASDARHRASGASGPFYYPPEVYQNLGLGSSTGIQQSI